MKKKIKSQFKACVLGDNQNVGRRKATMSATMKPNNVAKDGAKISLKNLFMRDF